MKVGLDRERIINSRHLHLCLYFIYNLPLPHNYFHIKKDVSLRHSSETLDIFFYPLLHFLPTGLLFFLLFLFPLDNMLNFLPPL
jgi:hypothetical protein